jgi:hypothetical protein
MRVICGRGQSCHRWRRIVERARRWRRETEAGAVAVERAGRTLCVHAYSSNLRSSRDILYIRSPGLPITRGSSGQTVQSGRAGSGSHVYIRKSGVLGFSFHVRRRRLPDSARSGGAPASGCGGRESLTSTCGGDGDASTSEQHARFFTHCNELHKYLHRVV